LRLNCEEWGKRDGLYKQYFNGGGETATTKNTLQNQT
jgi:hypothetical protein